MRIIKELTKQIETNKFTVLLLGYSHQSFFKDVELCLVKIVVKFYIYRKKTCVKYLDIDTIYIYI
jgi:hypothetical protein